MTWGDWSRSNVSRTSSAMLQNVFTNSSKLFYFGSFCALIKLLPVSNPNSDTGNA